MPSMGVRVGNVVHLDRIGRSESDGIAFVLRLGLRGLLRWLLLLLLLVRVDRDRCGGRPGLRLRSGGRSGGKGRGGGLRLRLRLWGRLGNMVGRKRDV